jgi:hypothetical protein
MKSSMEREHFAAIVARHLGSSIEAVRSALPKHTVIIDDLDEIPTVQTATERGGEAREILIRASIQTYEGTALAKRLKDEYARIIGPLPEDESLPERVLFEAGLLFGESPTETAGDDLLHALEKAVLTRRLHDATTRLRVAESQKDTEATLQAQEECTAVLTRIASLG